MRQISMDSEQNQQMEGAEDSYRDHPGYQPLANAASMPVLPTMGAGMNANMSTHDHVSYGEAATANHAAQQ